MIVRPTSFAVGKEALSWIRQRGRMTDVRLRARFLLSWQSFWFDRNLALQRKLAPGTWQGDDPVFILGLWRSGTTFMHGLLGAVPGLAWPATWQCMNPSSFKMVPPPGESKSVARPMDDFSVNTYSPQEDEFALLALGVPSVYRCFFDPGRLSEVSQWLDPASWCGRPDGWIEKWREFLGGISVGDGDRLLLKSPNHTFRIRALVEEFPRASYVWLVREPAETLFSNRKMWVAMFRHYALWKWQESELDEFIGKAFHYAAESLAFATAVLGRDRLVVVDSARLRQAPAEIARAVCDRLHLGEWSAVNNDVLASIADSSKHRGGSYPGCQVGPGQRKAVESLGAVQLAALGSHGVSESRQG